MSISFQGCPKSWPVVNGLASSSSQTQKSSFFHPRKAVLGVLFGQKEFSRRNGRLSPIACLTYSESHKSKASNEEMRINSSHSVIQEFAWINSSHSIIQEFRLDGIVGRYDSFYTCQNNFPTCQNIFSKIIFAPLVKIIFLLAKINIFFFKSTKKTNQRRIVLHLQNDFPTCKNNFSKKVLHHSPKSFSYLPKKKKNNLQKNIKKSKKQIHSSKQNFATFLSQTDRHTPLYIDHQVDHSIHLQFRINLQWKENRVKYQNLKDKTSLNALTNSDVSMLWLPLVIYDNTDQKESTRLGWINEWVTKISVMKEGDFTRSGLDEVDEAEIFEGAENTLTMTQTYTHEFQCKYKLQRYPFDSQVNTDIWYDFCQFCSQHCAIKMSVESETVDLLADQVFSKKLNR